MYRDFKNESFSATPELFLTSLIELLMDDQNDYDDIYAGLTPDYQGPYKGQLMIYQNKIQGFLAELTAVVTSDYADLGDYNNYKAHAVLRGYVHMLQFYVSRDILTYDISRSFLDAFSSVVPLMHLMIGQGFQEIWVKEAERGSAGAIMLELGMWLRIGPLSYAMTHRTANLNLLFPDNDFLENATLVAGGQHYGTSSEVLDHSAYRAHGKNINDIWVVESTFLASSIYPYSYDKPPTSSLPSFSMKSNIAGLGFWGESMDKLNVTMDASNYDEFTNSSYGLLTPNGGVGDMSNMKHVMGIGMRTTADSPSPRCFYRDNLGMGTKIIPAYQGEDISRYTNMPSYYPPIVDHTYKAAQPFTRQPDEIINYPGTEINIDGSVRPGLAPGAGGVSGDTAITNSGTELYCSTSGYHEHPFHFGFADGCFPQLHTLPLRATCSGHGNCNMDSTCTCFCGYSGNNCSVLVDGPRWTQTQKNRIMSGAPAPLEITKAYPSAVTLEKAQVVIITDIDVVIPCIDTGQATRSWSFLPNGRGLIRLDVDWVGGTDRDDPTTYGTGHINLPAWNSGTAIPPGNYTLCYCTSDTYCFTDCDFFDRGDVLNIIPAPRLGPIGQFGDIRVINTQTATFRITISFEDMFFPAYALENGDEIFIAPDCATIPVSNTTSTSGLIVLAGRDTAANRFQEVAAFKSTSQSSTANHLNEPLRAVSIDPSLLGYSHLAVDGSVVPDFLTGSCTHTELSRDPWWQVDLKYTLEVVQVEIFNRGDQLAVDVPGRGFEGNMLKDFEVWVSDEATVGARGNGYASGKRCGDRTYTAGLAERFNVYCAPNVVNHTLAVRGRYVVIRIPGDFKALSLCEVFVYEANVFDTMGLFFETPNTLFSPFKTELSVCATTREMRAYGEALKPNEFVQLEDKITVIQIPSLPTGTDDSVRAITNTAPNFAVELGRPGDFFFLSPDGCGVQTNLDLKTPINFLPPNTPPHLMVTSGSQTGLMMISVDTKLNMPFSPLLTDRSLEMGYPAERVLFVCYACRGSEADDWRDFITLNGKVHLIPQPVGVLQTFQLRADIRILYFNQPLGTTFEVTPPGAPPPSSDIAGQLGDVFILSRDTCVGASYMPYSLPEGPSDRVTVQEGGIVGLHSIAAGMLNQLELYMNYRICYATSESGADSDTDFVDLSKYIMIRLDERAPEMEVDTTVNMGEAIVVNWFANHGLTNRTSHKKDWIGLYKYGDCTDEDQFKVYGEYETPIPVINKHADIHRCYLHAVDINEEKVSGQVRFEYHFYKQVGEFEVRYFLGDSKDGQGMTCRGLRKRDEGEYVHCVLEAAYKSRKITVVLPNAVTVTNEASDIGKIPGLESYCDGPLCSYE